MPKIEENVETLIMPIIEDLGYILYDVQYVKEAKDYYLRVFIDKKEGISLEDCEKVNNAITDILDEKNYIKDQYFLEISSPGIERILRKEKHLEDNIGQKVCVNLFKPIECFSETDLRPWILSKRFECACYDILPTMELA